MESREWVELQYAAIGQKKNKGMNIPWLSVASPCSHGVSWSLSLGSLAPATAVYAALQVRLMQGIRGRACPFASPRSNKFRPSLQEPLLATDTPSSEHSFSVISAQAAAWLSHA